MPYARKKDIGHVAPSFESKHVTVNSLVIRPELRVSLRLGDFENLFANALDDKKPAKRRAARMERMQVLGLFYFPLKHAKAEKALEVAWDHYKKKILNGADDDAADEDLRRRLKTWIVADGRLPAPAKDPAAPEEANFARIRFPGGFSFVNSLGGAGLNLNYDKKGKKKYDVLDFGKEIYDVEAAFEADNPALHKVPLVALVEKKNDEDQWVPAPGVSVYFQLVPPYVALPAFRPADSVAGQIDRPPLRDSSIGPNWAGGDPATAGSGGDFGPRGYNKKKDPADPDGALHADAVDGLPKNPQVLNCPKDCGGKNGVGNLDDGTDVADVIFSTTEMPGFTKAPCTGHKPYAKAVKVAPTGEQHKHAVKVATNEDGEAGVVFMPGRFGGDRYRLRAYVGPDSLTGPGSDGTGISAVSVDTGTFVVWRSIRFSRHVKQKASANPAAILRTALETIRGGEVQDDATYRWWFCFSDTSASGLDKDLPALNLGLVLQNAAPAVGALKGPYDSAGPQFARAYCELEIDPGAASDMLLNDWKAAVQQAIKDMKSKQGKLGLSLDVEKLFYADKIADGTLTQENCLVHLPMRSIDDYNAAVKKSKRITAKKNQWGKITDLVSNYGWAGFMRYFTRDGYLPGLTILQAGFGCTWQGLAYLDGRTPVPRWGGMATEYRGAFDWFGGTPYPATIWAAAGDKGANDLNRTDPSYSYDYTTTCCHEMGHLLFRVHAPGANSATASPGGGFDPKLHDPLAKSVCLMAYKKCEGQFCAKCLFALRGWKLANLTDV